MRTSILTIAGMVLLALGAASVSVAQVRAPEIDPASGASALALLGGVLLVMRARKR